MLIPLACRISWYGFSDNRQACFFNRCGNQFSTPVLHTGIFSTPVYHYRNDGWILPETIFYSNCWSCVINLVWRIITLIILSCLGFWVMVEMWYNLIIRPNKIKIHNEMSLCLCLDFPSGSYCPLWFSNFYFDFLIFHTGFPHRFSTPVKKTMIPHGQGGSVRF